jgi:hypothetical protein
MLHALAEPNLPQWTMRLSGIEIVVGEPSEKLPTCRRLNYIVSFKNDAGEECQQRHETLVHEQRSMIRRASRGLSPTSRAA